MNSTGYEGTGHPKDPLKTKPSTGYEGTGTDKDPQVIAAKAKADAEAKAQASLDAQAKSQADDIAMKKAAEAARDALPPASQNPSPAA